ncbi:MAG: hypothetical protein MUP47_03770 [Phycisphaerae bacterium]|nr:hypothetical protein [Phycisphaerae bacterium]
MSTELRRPVVRQTVRLRHGGQPLIVTLEPGDTISFRAKGRRHMDRTTLEACFWLAAKASARDEARLRAMARAERRHR